MGELVTRCLEEPLLEPPCGTDWIVEDLISVGLHLLVGPPKVGKSWLSLLLALSVSAGESFLGFATAKAGVLDFMAGRAAGWQGTATELLEAVGAGDVTVAAFGKHLAQHAGFMLDRGVVYSRVHAAYGSVLTLRQASCPGEDIPTGASR